MAKNTSETKFGRSINAPLEDGTYKTTIRNEKGEVVGEAESFDRAEAERRASERAAKHDD